MSSRGGIGRQNDPERVARIQARAAARPQRLRPPPGPARYGRGGHYTRKGRGKLVAARYVRCLLGREPATHAEALLADRMPLTCGAVVFAGDELDHLQDVHELAGPVTPGMFGAVERGDDDKDDETGGW